MEKIIKIKESLEEIHKKLANPCMEIKKLRFLLNRQALLLRDYQLALENIMKLKDQEISDLRELIQSLTNEIENLTYDTRG